MSTHWITERLIAKMTIAGTGYRVNSDWIVVFLYDSKRLHHAFG